MIRKLLLITLIIFVDGCASPNVEPLADTTHISIEELRAIKENYKDKQLTASELVSFKKQEQTTYKFYFSNYLLALKQNNYEQAIEALYICQEIMPDNNLLANEISRLGDEITTEKEVGKISTLIKNNNISQASELLTTLLQKHPNNEAALLLLEDINEQSNHDPKISLSLNHTDIKDALTFVTRSFSISSLFDESIKPQNVTMNIDAISFYDAISYLVKEAGLGYSVINEQTVLFYQMDKNSINKFSDQFIRSYYLNTISAKDMAAILRSAISIDNISVNEDLNTVIIRADKSQHHIVNKIIKSNDHPKAEVLFEVEILEINKTNTDRVGVDYDSYEIGIQTGSLPLIGEKLSALKENGAITIPNIALSAFKQDVDAKTLSNPKVRVLDGKKAKIHIGDQVPLRSSSTTDSDGDTTTTYEYRDTGILLEVQPKVYTDNSVEISLELEVSSLGENLGTSSEPAYRIGTRVAETSMVLKNGETALLGGLISQQGQDSATKLAGLEHIPILKHLFNYDDARLSSTDVLLSITPLVIRPVRSSKLQGNLLSVGTNDYQSQSVKQDLQTLQLQFISNVDLSKPEPVVLKQSNQSVPTSYSPYVSNQTLTSPETDTSVPMLKLGENQYSVTENQDVSIPIIATGAAKKGGYSMEIAFNPAVSTFQNIVPGEIDSNGFSVETRDNRLFIEVSEQNREISENSTLFTLKFQGRSSGTSFVILRPIGLMDNNGKNQNVEIRNTKIKVK